MNILQKVIALWYSYAILPFFHEKSFFLMEALLFFFFSSHWIMIFMSQREISSAIVSCFIIWEIKINFKNENLLLLGRLKNYPCLPNPAQKFSFCPGKKAGPHHCICTRKKISREGSLFSCTAFIYITFPDEMYVTKGVSIKRCMHHKVYISWSWFYTQPGSASHVLFFFWWQKKKLTNRQKKI